ncbi:hypothetical protein SS50377_24391 [Spironucleus salmonicida]|uniref:Uncharacterized protein n=1 Tax=Spironucleus salmonicida TaxID=348837 RepID=V6LYZ8_9EUKA|nr:hypothetical protein SS50377_24391 [Spironucleus salmonicida]|eukprot:EST46059.1 Hypothetical protein SS50377_14049 [Spironucleus salmonicida]
MDSFYYTENGKLIKLRTNTASLNSSNIQKYKQTNNNPTKILLTSQHVNLSPYRPLSRPPLYYTPRKGYITQQIQSRQGPLNMSKLVIQAKDYTNNDLSRPICQKISQIINPIQNHYVSKSAYKLQRQQHEQWLIGSCSPSLIQSKQLEYFQNEAKTIKVNTELDIEIGLDTGIIREDIPKSSYMYNKVQYQDSIEVEVYPVVKDKQWH